MGFTFLSVDTIIELTMEVLGYKCKTTFWQDFTIADSFGAEAIQDTFDRATKEWGDDKIYGTELAMVLNWKCYYHYETGEDELSALYGSLWEEFDTYVLDSWRGEKLKYYLKTTD